MRRSAPPKPDRSARRQVPGTAPRPAPTYRRPSGPHAGFVIAHDLIRAARVVVGETGAMLTNFTQARGEITRQPAPKPFALQPLAQNCADRMHLGLAGQRSDFAGQAIG